MSKMIVAGPFGTRCIRQMSKLTRVEDKMYDGKLRRSSRISLGTVKIKFGEFDRKAMVRIRRPPSGEGIVGLDRRKGFVVTLGRGTDISRSGWMF